NLVMGQQTDLLSAAMNQSAIGTDDNAGLHLMPEYSELVHMEDIHISDDILVQTLPSDQHHLQQHDLDQAPQPVQQHQDIVSHQDIEQQQIEQQAHLEMEQQSLTTMVNTTITQPSVVSSTIEYTHQPTIHQ